MSTTQAGLEHTGSQALPLAATVNSDWFPVNQIRAYQTWLLTLSTSGSFDAAGTLQLWGYGRAGERQIYFADENGSPQSEVTINATLATALGSTQEFGLQLGNVLGKYSKIRAKYTRTSGGADDVLTVSVLCKSEHR
jgi:hypothetical protein